MRAGAKAELHAIARAVGFNETAFRISMSRVPGSRSADRLIASASPGWKMDGVIHATRAVMAGMRARRYGRIVNVGSIAAIGRLPRCGPTSFSPTRT